MGDCIHIATFVEIETHHHNMIQTANITNTPLRQLQRLAKDLSVMGGWPVEDCMDAVCMLAHKRVSREDVAPSPAS